MLDPLNYIIKLCTRLCLHEGTSSQKKQSYWSLRLEASKILETNRDGSEVAQQIVACSVHQFPNGETTANGRTKFIQASEASLIDGEGQPRDRPKSLIVGKT